MTAMKMPRSVAVYARISSDQEGTALGVKRQLADCRVLCERIGWVIGEEYTDNDVSAYSGKRRPAFERMMTDLAGGRRDAVVVYHQDRLTRRPTELERFVDVLTSAGVKHVRFVSGPDVDVTNGDGLLMLRVIGAVAANESATKSRRIKRKMEENAAAGRPHGTGNRPFGYEADAVTIRESEAVVIRDLAARYLAGESLRSLAVWLEDNEISTVNGKVWRTPTVRAMLESGRIAGLRDHLGVTVATAVWDPIISVSDHERLLAKFKEKSVSGRRVPRSYLLTGLLRCGGCGNRLYSSRREDRGRRYVYVSGPDHGGCGRLTVVAGPLEEFLCEAVLQRLDSPRMAKAMSGRSKPDRDIARLTAGIASDRDQLNELAGAYGQRKITLAEWIAARKTIEERMHDAERLLARSTNSDALIGFVGSPKLRTKWATLNLTRQQAIVSAVIDQVTILPKLKPASQALDPHRVKVAWRL
jgi:site-specific DNA recombinase